MTDPGRVRSWRALDDTDMARPLGGAVIAAIARGTVVRTELRHPSWTTLRFDEGEDRFYVDLPAIVGSGFHHDLDAMTMARHLIAACDDAGQEPQDVEHCTRMASIILGSVPGIQAHVHDATYVCAFRETGKAFVGVYDPVSGKDEWMDRRADPAVIAAVGMLCPLWFRPERQSSGNWRCTRVGFEEIEVLPTPADPIEIMRAIESARKDRPWNDR